jgi:hypothetical protein
MTQRLEHTVSLFKSAARKIKVLFYRYKGKNALIFLFFVLLSFGFWVLLSLQEEYEIEVSFPVRYKNMPAETAFAGPQPPHEIKARIKDKGSVLLNYTAGNTLSALEMDMKNIAVKSNGTFSLSEKELETALLKRLAPTTSLLTFAPPALEAPYSKLGHKTLPVAFAGKIGTEPGFHVSGEIHFQPSEVKAFAGDVALDTLRCISTVYTEIRKGNRTVRRTLRLQPPPGVTLEPSSVQVTIPIEEYTEKTLEIPIAATGVPARYTIRMFPPAVKVSCLVPLSRFKELDEDRFYAYVSLETPDESIYGKLPVRLAGKPDWVNAVSVSPETIEFILEQNLSDD